MHAQKDALLMKNLILPTIDMGEPKSMDPDPQKWGLNDESFKKANGRGASAAERVILNWPHPLTVLSDPRAYGPGGSISRHHNPHNYAKAIGYARRRVDPGDQDGKGKGIWS